MKFRFICLVFLCLSVLSYAESFIDGDSDFFSSESSIINSDNSFINTENKLISDENNFLNKKSSFLNSSSNLINDDNISIGTYNIVVKKNNIDPNENIEDSIIQNSMVDSYMNEYGKFLEIVTSIDPKNREKFFQYFSDWQWSGQNENFFKYSKHRAEREKQIELCYDGAIKKFGIGTSIVATVWIVSWVVPGGQVVSTAMLVIAKSTTIAALGGGAIGGITSASIAFIQDKRDDELMYVTINGAADGYLIGAITGFAQGTFTAVKNFSGAIAIEKNIYTKAGLVINKNGKTIGKTIHFAGVDNADNIYYIAKNSTSVFDKYGNEVAKIAKYKDNFVLYNKKGRILGYLGKDGQLVSYCDPSSTIIKGQSRAKWTEETRKIVKQRAIMNGQYNPKTGNFLDAVDGVEIIGNPHMGHISGYEYTNELQRAFANGKTEEFFRERMNDPAIYYLEDPIKNMSHARESIHITIDSFRGVEKDIGEELWIKLLTQ